MTSQEAPAPHGARTGPLPFDTSVAHQARIYDYLLGGKDNYCADRAAALGLPADASLAAVIEQYLADPG